MALKLLIGLVGFRCCGKSTLRSILSELGYPVFDTNSVLTGDPDAMQITLDEILKRYGRDRSYLLFLETALREFVSINKGIIFIDSLKVSTDAQVLEKMFPDCAVELWYLHASDHTRSSRYMARDIRTRIRSENLDEHDRALERHGILSLIKSSSEAINMELPIAEIKERVKESVKKLLEKYPALCS